MVRDTLDMFSELSARFRASLQRTPILEELALPGYQARLLTLIFRIKGCSQQTLADLTERDKAQVARSLKDLENRGLITRSASRGATRAVEVSVTHLGAETAGQLISERAKLTHKILGVLAIEERQVLDAALDKILAALDSEQL